MWLASTSSDCSISPSMSYINVMSTVDCTVNFWYHKSVLSQLEYMPHTALVKSLLVNLSENCSEMLDVPVGYKSWNVTSCMCSHMPVCLYMCWGEWFNLNTLHVCLCCLICIPAHGNSMCSEGWMCPAGMAICLVIWLENGEFLLYVRGDIGEDLLNRELPSLGERKSGSDGNGSDVPLRTVHLGDYIRQGQGHCLHCHECKRKAASPLTTLWKVVLIPGASLKVVAF